jgi:hypothetical protein
MTKLYKIVKRTLDGRAIKRQVMDYEPMPKEDAKSLVNELDATSHDIRFEWYTADVVK